jgi:hypothetical protein
MEREREREKSSADANKESPDNPAVALSALIGPS